MAGLGLCLNFVNMAAPQYNWQYSRLPQRPHTESTTTTRTTTTEMTPVTEFIDLDYWNDHYQESMDNVGRFSDETTGVSNTTPQPDKLSQIGISTGQLSIIVFGCVALLAIIAWFLDRHIHRSRCVTQLTQTTSQVF